MTCVTDGQHHMVTRALLGGIFLDIGRIQESVFGFDDQLSALRHGVTGVEDQVHEDLFDLRSISPDRIE